MENVKRKNSKCRMQMERSYLLRVEFELILLMGDDLAGFHWEDTITLCLDQRKLPMCQIDVVLPLEVCVNGDNLLFARLPILQVKSKSLCV
jgi:hypothetical protein